MHVLKHTLKRILKKRILAQVLLGIILPAMLFGQVGRSAASFTLDNLEGKRVTLQSVLGKGPVVITFWATWCRPCLQELGELQQLMGRYGEKGVTAVAISMDSEKTLAKVKPLALSRRYPFTVLVDPGGEAARRYYIQNPPYTLVLDEKGIIRYSHTGYVEGDEHQVEKVLDELLSRK